MSSQFIVLSDSLPAHEARAVTKYLRQQLGVTYWHWLPTAWLIVDSAGRTSRWWRDELHKVAPTLFLYLFRVPVEHSGWSAHSPKRTTAWLKAYWNKKK